MFHPKRKKELLKRMRESSWQVQSMKCSNEISCQGDDNDYHFKGMFSLIFNGFVFVAELDKPNKFERSLACDVCFVCPSQKT